MHTESEAAERWCPFARVQGRNEPAANRFMVRSADGREFDPNPVQSRCIGSRCMAWRWATGGPDMGFGDVEETPGLLAARVGFCGLAGKGD